MFPADRQRPNQAAALRRLGAILAAIALFAGLGVVFRLWIHYSIEHLPVQLAAREVTLPQQTQRVASAFPDVPRSVVVLTYHDVGTGKKGAYSLSPERFAEQMQALAVAGFTTVPLSTVTELLHGGHPALPSKPLLITFDDGLAGTYTAADPILAAHHFSAVSFVLTKAIRPGNSSSSVLSEAQIRFMSKSGRWEFGSHTHDLHQLIADGGGSGVPALTNLATVDGAVEPRVTWQNRVDADLAQSKAVITRLTGHPPVAFAFPYGDADRETNDPRIPSLLNTLLSKHGFSTAFLSYDADSSSPFRQLVPAQYGQSPLRIPRIGVTGKTTADDLLANVRSVVPDPLALDISRHEWVAEGGTCAQGADGSLTLRTTRYVKCLSQAHAAQWGNYRLTASITGVGPCTAIATVHEENSVLAQGRLEVALGASRLVVRERTNSTQSQLAEVPYLGSGEVARLQVDVLDETMTVRIDGQQAARVNVHGHSLGAVGFAAACSADSAGITVRSASLNPL